MQGFVYSFQSLGTVDGPGVRVVIFGSGCPLRCVYCHNPESWDKGGGELISTDDVLTRVKKFKNYIKGGGVTLSGGEPLCQAEFFLDVVNGLRCEGIHTALDTSGAIDTPKARELLSAVDLVLLDIKFTSDDDYRRYTGASLDTTLGVLSYLESIGKPVWIRHVVVPGINDSEADAMALGELLSSFSAIERIEFLPFRKLCLEKYEEMGIPFPLSGTPAASATVVSRLEAICREAYSKK